jgi:hypothetical protein
MKNVEIFYPSYTKKAVTFTIDDGNMTYDKMMRDILAPAGIRGTFNLCSNIHEGREEETVAFYSAYDVSNHCKYHPLINYDGVEYVLSDEEFDEITADDAKIYRVNGRLGFFWVKRPNGWRQMVFKDDFLSYIKEGKEELERLFKGREIKDFVWPYGRQDNCDAHEFIRATHRSSRITGCRYDKDGFNIPADKYAWSYNADHSNLLEVMGKYEAYPDDGRLKFFSFGVHSIDYENAGCWDTLRIFAEKYGNRPGDYWYTTVGEVFDYEQAVDMLEISEDKLINRSDLDIYIKIDGERLVIAPGEVALL